MAGQDVSTIATAPTGQFKALSVATETKAAEGKPPSDSGKNVPQPTVQELEIVAQALSDANRNVGRDLRFEVNLESGRSVIQVLDSETGEIIRVIPPEKAKIFMSGNTSTATTLLDEVV